MTYLITALFIALDFITGLIKAFATSAFASTKMREGLFHKMGLILCVVLGVLVDYAQQYVELGLSVRVPVAAAVCAYIILMEISSTIENLCGIDPSLVPETLSGLFGKVGQEKTEDSKGGKEDG